VQLCTGASSVEHGAHISAKEVKSAKAPSERASGSTSEGEARFGCGPNRDLQCHARTEPGFENQ